MFSSLISTLSRSFYPQPANDIDADTHEHEVSSLLNDLITTSGAGSWPPRATFGDEWPAPLRPYHHIYKEMSASLCVEESELSLDDEVNSKRIQHFRSRMHDALTEIDLSAVLAILEATEDPAKTHDKNTSILTTEIYNGFFACIVFLRHAFRWGVIPSVRVAQDEKLIHFPPHIDKPWPFIQRHFGIETLGGCNTAFFLCNYDSQEEQMYQATCDMPLQYQMTEQNFSLVLRDVEKEALPLYRHYAKCITFFDRGMRKECFDTLITINSLLLRTIKISLDLLTDSKIPRRYWMGYVQGFQAFGAGQMLDGEYVESGGTSGNQTPFILITDAFFGMKPSMSEDEELSSIPTTQRNLLRALRKYNFPQKVKNSGDVELLALADKCLGQMRSFRKAHLARMKPYLRVTRPERKVMTAGKGVMESETVTDNNALVDLMEGILKKRIEETKLSCTGVVKT